MDTDKSEALSELRSIIASMESASVSLRNHRDNKPSLSRRPAPASSSDPSMESAENGLSKAKKKIERLCNVREQCSSQLHTRLLRDGFDEDVAAEAITWALRCGLVDDERFADTLVRSRLSAGKGISGIARELTRLGIDPSTVELLQEREREGSEAEIERALLLLRRKPPRAKNAREAGYRRLVQKGYSSAVAASAARQWWESLSDV